jgi:hypothetical protein
VRIENERSPRRLTGRIMAAVESAGLPRIDDYNGSPAAASCGQH